MRLTWAGRTKGFRTWRSIRLTRPMFSLETAVRRNCPASLVRNVLPNISKRYVDLRLTNAFLEIRIETFHLVFEQYVGPISEYAGGFDLQLPLR